MHQTHDIGAHVKQALGLTPRLAVAAALNGPAIDRQGYGSCSVAVITGADAGAPDSFSVATAIEHSDDGATNWAAFTDGGSVSTVVTEAAVTEASINLAGAKRYIRVSPTVAFVNGTTPSIGLAIAVTLGGADKLPAA